MSSFISIENFVFDNLDTYISTILDSYGSKRDTSKKFIRLVEQKDFTVFFLHTETLIDLMQDGKGLERFSALKEEGFFLLSPTKTNTVIGKSYEVSYCKNDTRIINKNLTRFGYIFITKTEEITKSEDQLLLCSVVEGVQDNVIAKRRLVEVTPGLFLFFNGKSKHQVLLINQEN